MSESYSRIVVQLTPRERELLNGMGNCFASCHADFEETVQMVGGARGMSKREVKKMLDEIREKYSRDPEYLKLRSRLPEDFAL